jgi:hypothetical protein
MPRPLPAIALLVLLAPFANAEPIILCGWDIRLHLEPLAIRRRWLFLFRRKRLNPRDLRRHICGRSRSHFLDEFARPLAAFSQPPRVPTTAKDDPAQLTNPQELALDPSAQAC